MRTINRNEVFQNFPKIRDLISNFQNAFFDDEYDSKDDEMFDAINYENKFETENFSLRVPNKNLEKHSEKLAEKIKQLLDFLKTNELIIISHLKLNFFGNLENDYPKVINAYEKLSKHFPEKNFKEAIEIEKSELSDFVEIFFWLERCDSSIPEYVFWFDKSEKFCFYLCKYGNIHFVDLTNGNLITHEEISNLGFEFDDEDQFEQNAIEGRQIKI
ncbi:hypothetical protein [Chryseobacterium oryzae]|uniref:Uncharacterized protein n=1 Tax=Chryseobacterium oryzae TaxID=2929799 RepID=A0ABY4BCZ6_9FLAO|nr:hypothetical protein [Chryseobacterium oryzae]UOE37025.1 hypothetical protein MTP08_08065 [Chryseobacterium oryzae]